MHASKLSVSRRLAVAGALCLVVGGTALAQAPISFVAGDRSVGRSLKVNPQVAIPSYTLSFITDQQGTAAASIDARARLTASLTGVTVEQMRALANEAHADLKAKLEAAGFTVAVDEVAVTAAEGVARLPNNIEVKPLGASFTIGAGVQKAWVTVGADNAPGLEPLNNPGANPTRMMGVVGATRTLSQGSRKISSTLVMPYLIFDFVDVTAGRGLRGVNVQTKPNFALRTGSVTHLVSVAPTGPAASVGTGLQMSKDVTDPAPFVTIAEGEAAVRALSTGPTDGLGNRNARGDAFVVNREVWESLVRTHFQAYNAAVVAQLAKNR